MAVLTIVLSANVFAVCCNDVCYPEGICGSDGEWYLGCRDGNVQTYAPDSILDSTYPYFDGCLTCWCDSTNHNNCEWRARNDVCLWADEICVCDDGVAIDFCVKDEFLTGDGLITGAATVGLAGPPIDSFCLNRDYFSELCTWNNCAQGTTTPGVWETDPDPNCCSGDDDPELCGSSTCTNRNYLTNDKCRIKVSGWVQGIDYYALPDGATVRLEGETNLPPSGGTEPLKVTYETKSAAGDGFGGGYFELNNVYGGATYELVVEAEYYGTEVITPVHVAFTDYVFTNPIILDNEGECRPDCTLKGTLQCNLQCFDQPGCDFFNTYVSDTVCHERMPMMYVEFAPQYASEASPFAYDASKEYIIECCEGDEPIEKGEVEISSIGVGNKDVVRTERFMLYRGRTVKMMVDAFG